MRQSRDVAARPRQAVDQLAPDRIGHDNEYNRNSRGRPLRGRRSRSRDGDQDIRLERSKLSPKLYEPLGYFIGKALFQRNRLAVDVAETLQALQEGSQIDGFFFGATRVP